MRPENFEDVCKMLETVKGQEEIAELQAAAKNAIVSLDADSQFKKVESVMNGKKDAKIVSRYYPILAQTITRPRAPRLMTPSCRSTISR